MKNVFSLLERNIKLFLRNKATVFFSFLSTLILVLLYFLFIGRVYSESLASEAIFTNKQATFIVYSQMLAGVLVLNSMSLALGAFMVTANDFETKRVDAFLITPIKRWQLIVSYYFSGFISSAVFNIFTWIVGYILIGVISGFWLSAATFFACVGVLLVCAFIGASIMLLITVMVKSASALGVINGIAGTFLGFICGIYMPYSNLGKGVEAVGSFIPFTHLTCWFKNIVLNDVFSQLGVTGALKDTFMNDFFSANGVGFATLPAPQWLMILLSCFVAGICLTLACLLLRKRIKK